MAQYDAVARVPRVYPSLRHGFPVGDDGTVWVHFRPRDGVHSYLALDLRGEPLGRVVLPAESRIILTERDVVWIAERDEWGIDSVVRYGVRWE